MINKLYKIVEALNNRFPGNDDPFRILARLMEEVGEMAEQVHIFENVGIKRAKHGEPNKQHLVKEVQDIMTTVLHLVQHYGVERDFQEQIDRHYQRVLDEGLVSEDTEDTDDPKPANCRTPWIRRANRADAPAIVRLMHEYGDELLGGVIYLTEEKLLRDIFCGKPTSHILVAEDNEGALVGLLTWDSAYDWHCGTQGGNLSDFFIQKKYRGTGLALRMIATFCYEILKQGGEFFATLTLSNGLAKKMSARFAVGDTEGIHYTMAGRAISKIAKLKDADFATIVNNLPSMDDNFKGVEI